MYKLIVLEGINGCGKTTFVTKLAAQYGIISYKADLFPLKSNPSDKKEDSLTPAVKNKRQVVRQNSDNEILAKTMSEYKTSIICDRNLLSAVVYNKLSSSKWEHHLHKNNITYLLLDIDPEEAIDNLRKRGEDITRLKFSPARLSAIREGYLKIAKLYPDQVLLTTKENIIDKFQSIYTKDSLNLNRNRYDKK